MRLENLLFRCLITLLGKFPRPLILVLMISEVDRRYTCQGKEGKQDAACKSKSIFLFRHYKKGTSGWRKVIS